MDIYIPTYMLIYIMAGHSISRTPSTREASNPCLYTPAQAQLHCFYSTPTKPTCGLYCNYY